MIRTLRKYSRSRQNSVNGTQPQDTSHQQQHQEQEQEEEESLHSLLSNTTDDTLLYNRKDCLRLQHTYEANFTSYLPYVVREGNAWTTLTPHQSSNSTIFDDSIISKRIFQKGSRDYGYKRGFVIASELFKSGVLVFPSDKSLEIFKEIRKKVVIPANEIIPTRYKSKGVGLPLFKVTAPSLASLRKKCPFVIIHKYKETVDNEEEETFEFCKAYCNNLRIGVRRYTLLFTPDPSTPDTNFEITMFDHQSNPYCDTIYKDTRIRWVGTSIANVLQGSRKIQLMVLDDGKASLTDNLTPNNTPDPHNTLLDSSGFITNMFGSVNLLDLSRYYSSSIPPFGIYKDENTHFFPKKISKIGEVEVYEDVIIEETQVIDRRSPLSDAVEGPNLNSTLSVSNDSMVLLCMALALREQELKRNPGVSRRLSAASSAPFIMAPSPFGSTF